MTEETITIDGKSYRIRTEPKATWTQLQCPKCERWKVIDNDQLNGKVSILCDCGFHETVDLAKRKEG